MILFKNNLPLQQNNNGLNSQADWIKVYRQQKQATHPLPVNITVRQPLPKPLNRTTNEKNIAPHKPNR